MKLSVIVITQNEADKIQACLASVAFADEIIVLDSGSTDDTVALARAAGATVYETADWPGFGPQKNRALDYAQGEWVLSIDADERVPAELALEIQACLDAPSSEVFEMARLSDFCGEFIRHSGWWPDYVSRLFRRGRARFTDARVHEHLNYDGPVGRLSGHLVHYPYDDMEGLIAKVNRYSSDAAASMHARGRQGSLARALGHGFWTFIRIYFLRRGFLDGRRGVVLAVTAAAGSFFRYAKLMFLGDKQGKQ